MEIPILFVVSISLLQLPFSSPTVPYSLTKGSSLSVENPNDVLISQPNSIFSAGFHPVGENAYCFAIWFTQPLHNGNHTIVWMANRDQPVNGRLSKLSLMKDGNLILTDTGQFHIWQTDIRSNSSSVQLLLYDTGNLVVLRTTTTTTPESVIILWQSFDSPTDTLLPNQPLTRNTKLVSSRSRTNYSSGFYKLFFDDDNLRHFLCLIFDGLEVSSLYWPGPWQTNWEAYMSTDNNNRTALFDSSGHFKSSTDDLEFWAADYGIGIQRRLTIDVDGNVRMYSLDERRRTWIVSWQAIHQPCKIHGICGPNTLCTYVPGEKSGRKCSCLPGYKMKSHTDWTLGCEPDFRLSCNGSEVDFVQLHHVEFYGYDIEISENYTLERCEKTCLQLCNCCGFQFKFDPSGYYRCFPKSMLFNGYQSPGYADSVYLKLPKNLLSSYRNTIQEYRLDCSHPASLLLERTYRKPKENGTLRFMVWFACAFGGVEIICICSVWCFLFRTNLKPDAATQDYLSVATGFRKFSYNELKKASHNFFEEIGRGGGGIVYKGVLSDHRVAAIKRLNQANQGEAEFLAEVSTIGKLNHMNLIEMWGYCAEGKHKLLVYEYMEHGSLAENLSSNTLDSRKRFDIAFGTAKGLAYLHEECLEWVLHCDVKPQNILLDSNYQPKVADFGHSKLFNRADGNNSSFSRLRGTRGYMAPEWILNLPITSKADVYSYGVVVLELVTGKRPVTGSHASCNADEMEQRGLVKWVREKMGKNGAASSLEEILDPVIQGRCDVAKMEILVRVALQCAEEDKEARPTMKQVIEMLLHHEN